MPVRAHRHHSRPGEVRPWHVFTLVGGILLAGAMFLALREKETRPPPPPPVAEEKKEKPPPTLETYQLKSKDGQQKTLPEWIGALKNKDPKVRQDAASTLVGVDRDASPLLVPLLLETLKDDEGHVRRLSAYVLGNIRPNPDQVLPALAVTLRDKDPEVRRDAAKALVQLGRGKPDSLTPILRSASADKNADVRRLADYIRDNIKPAEPKVVSTEKINGKTPPGAYGIADRLVGKPAPKIEKDDLDGVPFSLKDQRGKVVLVTFWGDWSQASHDLFPLEKKIVEQYKGKPFVMIGVNSDLDKTKVKDAIKREKITWRSVWDPRLGRRAEDEWGGRLHDEWRVETMPTFYIVDGSGIVWCKFKDGERLEAALSVIMAEMEGK